MQTLPFTPQPEVANDGWRADCLSTTPQYNYHQSPGEPSPIDHDHLGGASPSRPILIVEDDRGLSTMLTLALEDARYTVEVSENGAEALVRLKTLRPRLILLDLRMPIMDGPTFLRQLFSERHPVAPLPPIIIMTAYGDIDPEVSRLGLPSIIKPMKIDALLQMIEQYAEAE
ncbi:MAG TPA: response regulator [Herpetosiphonaceae bacterium]